MFTSVAYAMGSQSSAQTTGGPPPIVSMFPLLMVMVIMYFMVLRPQKRRQQEQAQLLKSLQKHDEIVTSGGIHGTIVGLRDDTVMVRVDDRTRIEVDRAHISRVTKQRHKNGESDEES